MKRDGFGFDFAGNGGTQSVYKLGTKSGSSSSSFMTTLWHDIKHYIRKKVCRTREELIYRIQKFYRFKLTVERCRSYIDHLRTVIPIIIERRGDWSDC